ncbi:GTP cyclohydrolase II RibA [Salinimicrobium gaetbulicola]|uniref:GTP cyclohydrolase II RibA n=1 Tax=Salinimicrobium gaetbulicola TaxID=999702 RepID=A0ABW3IFX7_9FLAO
MEYKISECQLNTHFGNFDFYCFNFGDCENDNVLVLKNNCQSERPYLRIQSACFTSEIFRSKDCDCHEQLETSLELISQKGGLLIYLLQDGRGAGIFKKIKGMHITQKEGLNTAQAYDKLNIKRDPREYQRVVEVLNHFDIKKVKLLTNNPRKIDGLTQNRIDVTRLPIEIEPTKDSENYLKSKKTELGHLFNKFL